MKLAIFFLVVAVAGLYWWFFLATPKVIVETRKGETPCLMLWRGACTNP